MCWVPGLPMWVCLLLCREGHSTAIISTLQVLGGAEVLDFPRESSDIVR